MGGACSTLVLDLDGTISDPSLGIARCVNHALTTHGLQPAKPDAIREGIGPPLDAMFRRIAPGVTAADVSRLVATYRERYSDVGYAENTLYPDIATTLAGLKKAGLRLGVCTSKRRDFAVRILELFQIGQLFAFVDGGETGVSKDSQLEGLKNCGEIDSRAIMVGDRAVDISAASSNQLRSIGVLWGFGGRAELESESPWQIISQPGDLLTLVS
jgi:phosphoglycolate phosphatase